MEKQKPEIIRDNKKRGEWAESVFVARAAEHGLQVSKPAGDSASFDCVIGGPGKFVGVQVKCTIAKRKEGRGYICTVRTNNQRYQPGAFDFLAAYVIPEDAWYIVPAKAIGGIGALALGTEGSWAKYEKYLEAWELLREASQPDEPADEMNEYDGIPKGAGVLRMQGAMNFFRNSLEKSGRLPR